MKTKLFSIILFLTFFTLVAQVPSYVPTNGLVGYWPFSGNANDLSGNNNNGIVNGATLTTDRFGNVNSAYSFDGNDFIQAPNYASNSSFTVSCWVNLSTYNLNSLGSNDFIFFANHSGNNNSSRNFMIGYRNFGNENGFSSYIYNNTDVQLGGYATNQTPPSVNSWHNLVSVFENGTYIKMYLDGVLFYNQTSSVPTQNNMPNLPLFFGIGVATQFDFLKGKLDDIGFWNRALTAQEIANLYNPCATPPAAPVAAATQTFCATPAPTVADLVATGTGVQWYDAATAGNLLASTATLTNGQIAYASQTVTGCESNTRTAVTLSLNDPQITASATTVCSGTAVNLSASTTVNPLTFSSTCSIPTNLQTGLVGYYTLCGVDNIVMTGSGASISVHSTSPTADRFNNPNKAYLFNGLNSYINIGYNSQFNSNAITYSVWFKTNNIPNFNAELIRGGYGSISINNLNANNPQAGYPTITALNNTNTPINQYYQNSSVVDDNWHFAALTYDQSNGLIKLYIDGQIRISNYVGTSLADAISDIYIGDSASNLPFSGKIDDFGFWNRALTLPEIQQLYSGATYLWSTGETTATINPTPTATTTYWCDVTVNGVTCRKNITINVNSTTPAPTGAATQTFCATPAPTVADLVATGTAIQWYDAATAGNLLASSANLTNGQIAYASQTVSGCESTRTAVTVSLNDPQITASATTVCSGTAVNLSASTTALPITTNSTLPTNLQNGLVGYWPFNGNANDESGIGNNGTVNGALISSDRFGTSNNSYSFNRNIQNEINVVNSNSLNSISNITISLWVKLSSYGASNQSGYNHYINKSDQNNNHQFVFANNNTELYFYFSGGGNYFPTNNLPPLNQWTNVIVTYQYDGTIQNSFCKFYINGNLVDSILTNQALNYSNYDLRIGDFGNNFYNRLDGQLDDIAIYNRALTPNEVSQLYNNNQTTYLWSTGETTATINPTPTATTTYWCDVTVNGVTCRKYITITVDTAPAPTVTTPVTYCQNNLASPLVATGANLLWYTTPTGGTGSATAPTPDTTSAGTTTYYVSQSIAGCESPREVIDVIVNPTPALPTVTTPVIYCQNAIATALTATGTDLLWYTAPIGGVGSPTAPTPDTTSAGTTSFYVSQTLLGCEGPREVIDVIVNPTPALPTVTTPVTYCQNATASILTATGTGLLWYTTPTGGTGSTTAPTPDTTSAGTTSFYVSQTLLGCEGPREVIDIIVNPTPALPTVTTPVTYCQNATASTLTATGTGLLWYTTPTGGTGSTTAPTPDTTSAGTTSFYVSQTLLGCEGPREVITVTVNATPAVPLVTTPLTYCQNSVAIPLAATGTNLLWYTAPNGGIGSTTAPTPSTVTAGTTTYYVSQTVSGCESPREAIVVNITPTPLAPTAPTPITYCQYSTANALTATGTNLLWYVSATGGIGSALAPTPSTAIAGTRTYYVSQTVSGCESPRTPIVVFVSPAPFTPIVTSPVTYCQNSIATPLTAVGFNLLWYTSATGGTGSATAPTPSTTSPGTTTYYVSQTILGCESLRAAIVVTIFATPTVPTVTTPVVYCQDATATPLIALGQNILWYTTATGGTGTITVPTPDTTTAGTTTYYASQTISGCEGPRTPIVVTVNATPALPTVTTPVSYCQFETAATLSATGANLLWYTTATGGIGNATAPTPTTTIAGTTSFYVSQTVLGCVSPRAVIDVVVNAVPQAPTGNTLQYFCANIYPTIQNLILTQNSIYWYNSATSTTALAPSTPLVPGTTYYAAQYNSATGCQSLTRLAVTAYVINENAPTLVDDLTFCDTDEKTIADIKTNGANVIWYATPAGGTPLSSNYVITSSQVLYVASYNTSSGCESIDRQMVTITTVNCEVKANNLLTLDGNNLNDNLNVINIESFPANEIEIYNRYGQVVWRTENYNNTTNTFKGRANVGGIYQINENLPTGTYYYVLKYYNNYRNKYEVTKSYLYISNNN